nr:translation initiation factor IF-2-like [Equus asinus]
MPPAGAATAARKGAGPGPEPGTSAAAAAAAAAAAGSSSGLGGRRTGGRSSLAGAPRAAAPGRRKVCAASRELVSPRAEAENKNFPEKSPRGGRARGRGSGGEGRGGGAGGGKWPRRADSAAGSAGTRAGGAAAGEQPPARGGAGAGGERGAGGLPCGPPPGGRRAAEPRPQGPQGAGRRPLRPRFPEPGQDRAAGRRLDPGPGWAGCPTADGRTGRAPPTRSRELPGPHGPLHLFQMPGDSALLPARGPVGDPRITSPAVLRGSYLRSVRGGRKERVLGNPLTSPLLLGALGIVAKEGRKPIHGNVLKPVSTFFVSLTHPDTQPHPLHRSSQGTRHTQVAEFRRRSLPKGKAPSTERQEEGQDMTRYSPLSTCFPQPVIDPWMSPVSFCRSLL